MPPDFSVTSRRVDRGRRVFQVEDHAVLFVQSAHEVPHLWAQHALHRPLLRRHDVHFDVARAERSGDLETDETRAQYDGPPRRRRPRDDGTAIAEGSQRVHVRQVHARQRQSHRLGAGSKQQPVIAHPAAIAEPKLARVHVDVSDGRLQAQVDIRCSV